MESKKYRHIGAAAAAAAAAVVVVAVIKVVDAACCANLLHISFRYLIRFILGNKLSLFKHIN